MIKLLFVSTGLEVGGAETSLGQLIGHLDRSRFRCEVVSLGGEGPIGRRLAQDGVRVTALGLRPGLGAAVRALPMLRRIVNARRPNVVQTWMYHADLLGGLAARWAGGVPVVWGVRNSNLDPGQSKRSTIAVAGLCARLSCWIPQTVVSCSSRARDVHIRLGYDPARFSVIPNGFDLARFCPDADARVSVRRELGLEPQAVLAGVIGRWDPQKDHLGFLRAAFDVLNSREDLHVVLVGGGVTRENPALARALADSPELSRRCHLLGLREDVPRLAAALDVHVLPSAYGEAFPRVVGETMACGVANVVTDVGDAAEIVGSTGWVVPPRDPAALAAAILTAVSATQEERDTRGALARDRVGERYEIGRVTGAYADLYTRLAESA